MKNSKSKKRIIFSSVFASITIATIISAAIEAIIGYVAVYFFAPFWKSIMSKDKKDNNVEVDKQ